MTEKLPLHARCSDRIARRRGALRRIEEHHRKILAGRGGRPIDINPTGLIEGIREERDDELFGWLLKP